MFGGSTSSSAGSATSASSSTTGGDGLEGGLADPCPTDATQAEHQFLTTRRSLVASAARHGHHRHRRAVWRRDDHDRRPRRSGPSMGMAGELGAAPTTSTCPVPDAHRALVHRDRRCRRRRPRAGLRRARRSTPSRGRRSPTSDRFKSLLGARRHRERRQYFVDVAAIRQPRRAAAAMRRRKLRGLRDRHQAVPRAVRRAGRVDAVDRRVAHRRRRVITVQVAQPAGHPSHRRRRRNTHPWQSVSG